MRIALCVGDKGGPCQSARRMFVMPFCKASTSSNSSTTSLKHEGVAEATFRSRRLAIHIIVTIVKAMGSVNKTEVFKEELTAMRKNVKCLGEVAALAEVKAEAAGSSKQPPTKTPQKPAEEPRADRGKRKTTSTQSPQKKARTKPKKM